MAEVLTVIDRPLPGETWPAAIARRLRGEFAQRQLSMSKVAKLAGIGQSQFSRRMTGTLPFAIDELEHVCAVIGIDRDYILTGARGLPNTSDESLLLPRLDSNQQPFGEFPTDAVAVVDRPIGDYQHVDLAAASGM